MRGLLDGLVGVTKTVVTRVELGGPLFLAAVIGVLLEGYPWGAPGIPSGRGGLLPLSERISKRRGRMKPEAMDDARSVKATL
jgi:hypothetical protein